MLALPAGVATWSGWVGLGQKTGFGVVTPLPGIADGFQINTAVVLPVGVEAYAAYALGAWLTHSRRVSTSTRRFARWSAIGSLILGALGQVAFHLLEVYGAGRTPWQVTTAVSVLPVLVLGMGAALGHMLARDAAVPEEPKPVPAHVPEPRPEPIPDPEAVRAVDDLIAWSQRVSSGQPALAEAGQVRVPERVPDVDPACTSAAQHYQVMVARGEVPSIREIKRDLRVGQDRAVEVRAYLTVLAARQGSTRVAA
ncbi:hypothetical protein OIE66_40415 [Nonomuraea sp. NBC_01738]|uniref:hypothetical protein n=1 Tax=Nonomuraea sp. NBC_01738 TaxID=2976003 RepID=UPI002E15511C|nr:hypothetical protein OIE66_40415 [Nonomuraea sp. NBC_01738]